MKKKILFLPLPVIIIGALVLLAGAGGLLASIFIGGTGKTGEVSLQKGLVGHWKLDGNAKDSTPYSNHGTVSGAVAGEDRFGKESGAMSFNGSDDYVDVADDASLDITDAITISVWIKTPDVTKNYQYLVTKHGTTQTYELGFWGTTGKSFMGIRNEADTYQSSAILNPLNNNTWYHIIGVYNGVDIRVYNNGVLASTPTLQTRKIGTNTNSVFVGARKDGYFFNGLIDDVRIWNRALSEKEIEALYDSYDPGIRVSDLQKGLVGHWSLDGHGKDSTPYSNHGTLYGTNIAGAEDRFGKTEGAMSFNGTDDYVEIPDSPSLRVVSAGTVELWVYFRSFTDLKGIIGKADTTVWLDTDYGIVQRYAGSLYGVIAGGGTYNAISSPSLSLRTWYHVVFTWDGSYLRLYVNNVPVTPVTQTRTVQTSADPLRIGPWGSPTNVMDGLIDDVRIYNRALSENEIKRLYDSYDPGIRVSDLQKGLVGHWSLDGHGKDKTPYSNHGTLSGTDIGGADDRFGKTSGAMSFNGTDDYVDAGNDASLNITGAITISAWVKPNALGLWQRIAVKANQPSPYGGYMIDISDTKKPAFLVSDNVTVKRLVGNTTLIVGRWYHIVGVYNKTDLRVYLNGALDNVSSSYTNDIFVSPNPLRIGYWMTVTPFNGLIDDVRIWNRALSEKEIKTLYESYQ